MPKRLISVKMSESFVLRKPSAQVLQSLGVLERCCCLDHTDPNITWPKWLMCILDVQLYIEQVRNDWLTNPDVLKTSNVETLQEPALSNVVVMRAINALDPTRNVCCQERMDPQWHWLRWMETIVVAQKSYARDRDNFVKVCSLASAPTK